jgi:hypothetical protein
LNISGGIVSATNGHAVANSTGAVNISAGTVSAESGIAISNSSTGQITISGTAEITSANTDIESGTIFLASSGTATAVRLSIIGGTVENKAAGNAIRNNSTGAVNISDGTVKNTSTGAAIRNGSSGILNISGGTISATTGMAAINNSTGTINVSGGTVSATTGTAIYINTTGLVTVSGTAKITSANTNSGLGTIFLRNQMADTGARLEIKGGTVENRSSGNAIRNDSTGAINISGGTFPVTTGKPIDNASTGAVNISPAVVSVASKMVTKEGQISVNVTGMAGTTTFQWYKDGVAITGATSRTLDVKEIDDNGTYVCKVQNVVGEFSSAEVSSEAITVTIEEGDNNTILMIGAVIAIIAIGGLAVYWFVLRKK